MQVKPFFIAAICALFLSGCTTIVVDGATERSITSIGVTRIQIPEKQGNLLAFKRTGIGIGYGNAVEGAAWLGFDRAEWVIADPAECQLLIIIRSGAEAAQVEQLLGNLGGGEVCFANNTER